MSGMFASSGLMHLPLDYTQDLALLGVGVLALFVLSAVMILAAAVSDVVSHHMAHGHECLWADGTQLRNVRVCEGYTG